jgi:hypothetical protein
MHCLNETGTFRMVQKFAYIAKQDVRALNGPEVFAVRYQITGGVNQVIPKVFVGAYEHGILAVKYEGLVLDTVDFIKCHTGKLDVIPGRRRGIHESHQRSSPTGPALSEAEQHWHADAGPDQILRVVPLLRRHAYAAQSQFVAPIFPTDPILPLAQVQ